MRSIFLKIFLWFWLTMVLIALAFAFVWNLESETNPSRESLTTSAVKMYAASAAQTFESQGAQPANDWFRELNRGAHIRGALLTDDFRRVAGDLADIDPALLQEAKSGGQTDISNRGNFGYLAVTTQTPSDQKYIFVAELPRRSGGGLFHGSVPQMLLRWSLAIVISGVVCYALTLYLIQPLMRLRSAASTIAAGDFSVRVAPRLANRRDEMGELVRDFNQMTERIERLMETQQQLLRDISHELRSPLARLNVALELARKTAVSEAVPALDRIEQESERLNEMIGRLLTLARIKTLVDPPQHTTVALRPLLDQISEDAGFEAAAKNCRVEVAGAEDCQVQGSPELLHSAIENVVRNAVRHSPSGSTVQIGLACNGKRAAVSIRDEGPGVPEPELEKIFRPFYRLSNSREHRSGGTGIGLAITQEVARLHGGTVRARNAKPHGLIVELELLCSHA